jgi:hypothetical protein
MKGDGLSKDIDKINLITEYFNQWKKELICGQAYLIT